MLLALVAATGLLVSPADLNSLMKEADRMHGAGRWADSAKTYRIFESHSNAGVRFHALNRIAVAELNLGELTAAERTMKKTMQFLEANPNHAPESMGVLLANMGSLYLRRGQLAKAEEVLRKSKSILESVYGPSDLQTIRARDNFAVSLVLQGKLRDARALLEESIAVSKRPKSPDMAATYVNLALVLTDLGDNAKAESYYQLASSILPETHSDYQKVLFSLGRFYRTKKRWAESAEMYLKAAEAVERTIGVDGYQYALIAYEYLELPRKVVKKDRVKVTKRSAEMALRAHERDERRPSAVDYQDLIRAYK